MSERKRKLPQPTKTRRGEAAALSVGTKWFVCNPLHGSCHPVVLTQADKWRAEKGGVPQKYYPDEKECQTVCARLKPPPVILGQIQTFIGPRSDISRGTQAAVNLEPETIRKFLVRHEELNKLPLQSYQPFCKMPESTRLPYLWRVLATPLTKIIQEGNWCSLLDKARIAYLVREQNGVYVRGRYLNNELLRLYDALKVGKERFLQTLSGAPESVTTQFVESYLL